MVPNRVLQEMGGAVVDAGGGKAKTNLAEQARLFPIVRPVMGKMGTIVAGHIARFHLQTIYLVGGTALFPGIGGVIEQAPGVRRVVPVNPLFVTPPGIALTDGFTSRSPGE